MKIKVLKNFSCNGVKKMKGSFLTEEESKLIGDAQAKILLHNDFVSVIDPKKVAASKEKEAAKKAAHDKANAEKSAKVKAKREAAAKKQLEESKGN